MASCPACGADAFTAAGDGGSCARCGYTAGEANRCPHCAAVARVDGTGRSAVCAACGGPRIPGGHGGEAALGALREQRKALAAARIASVSTVVQSVFAVLTTLLGLAILPATPIGKILVFVIALGPLFLALRSRGRAGLARRTAADAGERAWQAAAEDVAAHVKDGITAEGLARVLKLDTADADKLLTSLTVHDRTRIDVGDDAEVRYSVPAAEPLDHDSTENDARAERLR